MATPSLVLASQSPRRRELLDSAGISYTVRWSDIDEVPHAGEPASDYVRRMAEGKARAVTALADEIILAADTTVVCKGEILGKPIGAEDASRMLHLLSGQRHSVVTGICLRHADVCSVTHEETQVWFTRLTTEEIEEYVLSGEPMDKAGGYAIQGIASRYIQRLEGSYSNVVGLPISLVWRELKKLKISAYPTAANPLEV